MIYGGHLEIMDFIFEFGWTQSLKDVFHQELRLSPWEGDISLGWTLHFHFSLGLADSCSSPSEDNTIIRFNFEKKTMAGADRKCKVMP